MYLITLKKGKEKKIQNGYPWIFANEVEKIEGKDIQGGIATVNSFDGKFIGKGYINHQSKIIVRILTRKDEEIDRNFFYEKIKKANDFRVELGYSNNYRVVFGEADNLPALVVDKYGDYLSVQFLSLGMDIRKQMIVDILVQLFSPKGIFERSDVAVRQKEGLPETKGILYGEINGPVQIEENGLKLLVDIENGQKTGYFLDQKENRANLKNYVLNKTVLDCFCNEGGFSLCAKKFGAKEVTAIDISQTAIDLLDKNAKLNNLQINSITADVFEKLREYKKENKKFDIVVLDPPAFTKSASTVDDAIKGYKDINILGLKIINEGGYLVTCSCSQHLSINQFLEMIKQSVFESGKQAKLVELRTQGKDHSTLIGADETLYLKVAILKLV